MNPISISTLATGFTVLGVALGLPSGVGLLLCGFNAIRSRQTARTPSSLSFGKSPDALLLMLKGMTTTIGALGRGVGSLGHFLLRGLAVIAGVGIVLASACWFTGRGLHAHANWARVSAFILVVLALIPSLLLALSCPKLGRVLLLVMVILCVFGLPSLRTGYATPTP